LTEIDVFLLATKSRIKRSTTKKFFAPWRLRALALKNSFPTSKNAKTRRLLERKIAVKRRFLETMRKVTFGGANSLDNFIARPDGAVDWLLWSDEAAAVMKDFWQRIDTILMGRKTYEVGLALTKGKKNPYSNIKTYVFSRTLKEAEGVEIVSENAAQFVRDLKEQDGMEICCMGGGEFARTLFEAGLIDEIGFNIHPVLLGQGIPLFLEMSRQIDLELIESKQFKNGCVLVSYRVKNNI
jgi:dihydrofolate reductase